MSTQGAGSVSRVCLQRRRPGFDPWVGRIPWRGKRQPTTVFFAWEVPWREEPGRLHRPWGPKESDVTEPLTLPKGGSHVES